jgi:MFS family permease
MGPLLGPPLGGFLTTYATWHWIFLINVPIGLIGIALVTRYIENLRVEAPDPFDLVGMLLAGTGVAGLSFGLSVLGLDFVPVGVVVALLALGTIAMLSYVVYARHKPAPVLDLSLFRLPTFRASVAGGFLFRLGVGALPFLLPLLLQLGFNMTPFQSGLITFTAVIGAMTSKTLIAAVLRKFGFRCVLIYNALISAAFLAACAGFTPNTWVTWMIAVLLIGGFFRSLQFTSINSIAYAEVDHRRMSRATSLVSVAQQLSLSTGVAVGALVVDITLHVTRHRGLTAGDFPAAFLFVAAISASSALVFARLPPDAGAEMANRLPAPNESAAQRVG